MSKSTGSKDGKWMRFTQFKLMCNFEGGIIGWIDLDVCGRGVRGVSITFHGSPLLGTLLVCHKEGQLYSYLFHSVQQAKQAVTKTVNLIRSLGDK